MSVPAAVSAQSPAEADKVRSCREFTQHFYDWYVPFTQKRLNGPAWNVALKQEAGVFSPKLFQALKQDSDAQAKAQGEIVGLDYDPFLNTQDPADHYQARNASWAKGRCSVEVWRASPRDTAAKSDQPDVVAELHQQNQQWRFLNFLYPSENTDLLTQLRQLKEVRMKP
ncbi:MAG TPA: hypothetical protein VL240_00685 [Candidatus Binatia bacterium]|nr:hypothetical protein [Candidatus Binatia bacterium]